ncbi:hypothetical protein HOY80DRAFT_1019648 [Tuber brumale]|nr:hypothetical protein HOY80DRAFT_1019648 [Tuber brumale]
MGPIRALLIGPSPPVLTASIHTQDVTSAKDEHPKLFPNLLPPYRSPGSRGERPAQRLCECAHKCRPCGIYKGETAVATRGFEYRAKDAYKHKHAAQEMRLVLDLGGVRLFSQSPGIGYTKWWLRKVVQNWSTGYSAAWSSDHDDPTFHQRVWFPWTEPSN